MKKIIMLILIKLLNLLIDKSKIYLLPQVINALGIFTISIFIIPNNNSTFLKFIFASTLLTIIFYFFVKFLIKKKG